MTMIASAGPDIPLDLMNATGRFAGPLGWNVDRATPRAAQWLESKFAPWAFSIVEDWAEGAFDDLEAVVFSRGDDNAQRLYYYLCELQRRGLVAGPDPLIFDIARIRRPTSADHTAMAVRRLAGRLGVADGRLEAAIVATNRQRTGGQAAIAGRVCLLAGTPPPDRRLHRAIEAAGFVAVGETLGDLWRAAGPRVDEATGDPCAAIGRQLHALPGGPRGFADPAAAVAVRAGAVAAAAVVLWYTEEDEAQVWHLPAQQAALDAAGVPVLTLTRCNWRATDGAPGRIAAFLRELAA
jgi:hypothetical protein